MVSPQTVLDFESLKEDMTVVSLHLKLFQTLYAEEWGNVDLLNDIAPGTFWVLQNALFDSIVMRVARLTDQPKMKKGKNLTLASLIEAVGKDGDTTMAQQLREEYAKVDERVKPIKELRHKVTAHTDLSTRRRVAPMPTVRMEELCRAVKSLGEFLNIFDHGVNGSLTDYTLSIMDGEGEVLLCRLGEAVAYREEVPDWALLGNPQRSRIRDAKSRQKP
jgi:AbiU2